MRLSRLSLRDFRGFSALDLELEPDVTVLVGINGAGKTSVLDALAHLLTCLTKGVRTGSPEAERLREDDVRVDASAASIEVAAEIDGATRTWRVTQTVPGHPVRLATDLTALQEPVEAAQRAIEAGAASLPLAVYYLTNRNALDIPERIRTRHLFDAVSAYRGALDEGTTTFREFFEWFRLEEDLFNEEIARKQREPLYAPEPRSRLLTVRAAIERVFPEAKDLRIERYPRQRMTLLRDDVRLNVTQLSDGERCLLAMAGDLARRMVLVAPTAERPLEHPAVVLIDELELHLHPRLQREILPRLQAAFPNTQFIVTTHSPQVLSSVHGRSVRFLEQFALRPLDAPTWRRDTNAILQGVFDDPGRPPEVAVKLNELRKAVNEDRDDDARNLIRELEAMIEGDDPEVFFLENLLPPEKEPSPDPR